MKNKKILLVLVSLLVVLTLQNVYSLGISPGRTTINFEPGLHKEVSFSVINSEHKDMSVTFSVRGDLAKYINLKQESAKFSSLDESQSFTYEINFPENFSPEPGVHEVEIIALEMPEDSENAGTFIGATVGVITQLHVYVAFPNKYVDAEINVIESGAGGNIIFLIPVINRGKLDIDDIRVVIDIYTSSNEKIASIESKSKSLKNLERKEFVLEWPVDVSSGTYRAVARIMYDGEVFEKEIEFNVGKMALEIIEIIIKDFQLGGVAKFDALVESRWSTDLKNVHLNVIVYDFEKEVMADFKSQTYDIDAFDSQRMVAFWDTEGVSTGDYDGKLILKYGKYSEKSIDRNVKIKVTNFDIEVFSITGHAITRETGKVNTNSILIILIIILVIGNIIWFLIAKRNISKRKNITSKSHK